MLNGFAYPGWKMANFPRQNAKTQQAIVRDQQRHLALKQPFQPAQNNVYIKCKILGYFLPVRKWPFASDVTDDFQDLLAVVEEETLVANLDQLVRVRVWKRGPFLKHLSHLVSFCCKELPLASTRWVGSSCSSDWGQLWRRSLCYAVQHTLTRSYKTYDFWVK